MLTPDEIYQQYEQKGNLLKVSEETGLPIPILTAVLETAGYKIRLGDVYWQALSDGSTIEQIAKERNITPNTVARSLRASGYGSRMLLSDKLAGTSPVSFSVSRRLRKAYHHFGLEKFLEALDRLEENPEFIKNENLGVKDYPVGLAIPLTPEQKSQISEIWHRRFTKKDGRFNKSLIGRQAIEWLIEQYDEKGEFAKPDGWEPRPLVLSQGGENPVAAIKGKVLDSPVHLPMWLYSRIEHLQKTSPRETVAGKNPAPMFADTLRDAILAAKPETINEYLPLKPKIDKNYLTTQQVMVVLAQEHLEKIAELKNALKGREGAEKIPRSDIISAALYQYLEDQGQLAVKAELWDLWEAIASQGYVDALSNRDLSLPETTEKLLNAGFIRRRSVEQEAKPKRKSVPVEACLEYIAEGHSAAAAAREHGIAISSLHKRLKPLLKQAGVSIDQIKRAGKIPQPLKKAMATIS